MTLSYELVRSSERLSGVAEAVERSDVVGLDIETTAFVPFDGQVRLVQLHTGRGIFVIDMFDTKTLGPVLEALASNKVVKIIQNAKFEQKWFLYHYDLELWPLFDTFRASAMIHNGKNLGHNLYDLYRRELGLFPEVPDKGGSDWSGPLTKEQYDYAAEDVLHLPALRDSLKVKLARNGLLRAAVIEFGAIIGEAAIETTGFRLDPERWLVLADEAVVKAADLRRQLEAVMPHPKGQLSMFGEIGGGRKGMRFSVDSTKDVLESFARLGVQLENTTENTLGMRASEHEVIPLFMKYRKAQKRATAFGPDYLSNIHPKTGRIHTDFWPLTGAGRYSSSKPNLQQVPREKAYRRCFYPGPGRVILVADYSQIELRIAAQISRDPTLMRVYREGEDAHTRTASVVSGVPMDRVTKDQRQAAKPVNFGLIYGLGAEKLVIYSQVKYGVTLTLGKSKEFIRRYFETYEGVRRWHERALRDFKRSSCVRTLSGRLRYLKPESHGEVFNTPVQGTGADGLKSALREVYHRIQPFGGRVKMVHMVHDEIVLEADDDPDLLPLAKQALEDGMVEAIQPLLPDVPVLAEGAWGPSWADKV